MILTTILYWLMMSLAVALAAYAFLGIMFDYDLAERIVDEESSLGPLNLATGSVVVLVLLCLAYNVSAAFDEKTAIIAELNQQIESEK